MSLLHIILLVATYLPGSIQGANVDIQNPKRPGVHIYEGMLSFISIWFSLRSTDEPLMLVPTLNEVCTVAFTVVAPSHH